MQRREGLVSSAEKLTVNLFPPPSLTLNMLIHFKPGIYFNIVLYLDSMSAAVSPLN